MTPMLLNNLWAKRPPAAPRSSAWIDCHNENLTKHIREFEMYGVIRATNNSPAASKKS